MGFDTAADFNTGAGGTAGAYGQNFGIYPPYGTNDYTKAVMDTTTKASGNGSLKFTIPSNSGADSSGAWFTNFSADLQTQFGENAEFFIQWRQRFSSSLLTTNFINSGGWKQVIIGTGDKPGVSPYQSCTALEVVVQEADMHGFPKMYNSCTGSASHPAYDGFVQYFNGDYKLQNGRPVPYCLLSQASTSFFPPSGNCFKYQPNEWMTFQVRIKTGPRVADEFTNSYVTLWIARQGQPSELVFDWGPYNLTAGDAASGQRFGKIWLLPYNTNKDATQSHPEAYTWYDELIISRTKIADPQ